MYLPEPRCCSWTLSASLLITEAVESTTSAFKSESAISESDYELESHGLLVQVLEEFEIEQLTFSTHNPTEHETRISY